MVGCLSVWHKPALFSIKLFPTAAAANLKQWTYRRGTLIGVSFEKGKNDARPAKTQNTSGMLSVGLDNKMNAELGTTLDLSESIRNGGVCDEPMSLWTGRQRGFAGLKLA